MLVCILYIAGTVCVYVYGECGNAGPGRCSRDEVVMVMVK